LTTGNPADQPPKRQATLVLIFIGLSVAIVTLGAGYYARTRAHMKRDAWDELQTVAALKVLEVSRWRRERLADATVAAGIPNLAARVGDAATGDDQAAAGLRRWLDALSANYDYQEAALVRRDLTRLLSSSGSPRLLSEADRRFLSETLAGGRIAMSPILVHEESRLPYILVAAPLGADQGDIGLVYLQIDVPLSLYPMITSWPTTSLSAESLLVRREGDRMVFLSPLRWQPGAPLSFSLPVAAEDLPAAMAGRGVKEAVAGRDYRGIPVLAAVRSVPGTDWFLVCKLDAEEVYRPLSRQLRPLLTAVLALLLATATSLGYVWHRQSSRLYRERLDAEAEQLRISNTLRETEARFRTYFEESLTGMAMSSADKHWTRVNRQLCRMLGYSADELTRMTWVELSHPDDVGTDLARYAEMLAGVCEGYSVDKRYVRKDGTILHAIMSVRAIRRPDHSLDYGLVQIIDISARKDAERRLGESQRMLQTVLNTIPLGVFWKDCELRMLGANRRFAEDAGYDNPEDVIGKTDFELSWAEHAKEYRNVDKQVMDSGTPRLGYEEPRNKPTGETMWLRVSKVPLLDENNVVAGVLGTYEDITEERRSRDAVRELADELERKNRELAQVVYVASHDLRSPLVNVQGFSRELNLSIRELAEALAGEEMSDTARRQIAYIMDEDIAESIAYILKSVNQMDRLLAGLLKISRLGRAAMTVVRIDLNQLLADVAAAMDYQIRETGAAVEIGDLAPCCGDATQLNQVFTNLLSNALKYRHPGRTPHVRIRSETDEHATGMVTIAVEDNGIGIAEAHREKIFELFHRLNPGDSDGEGLGLTTVRTILDRHHGRIRAESTPGRGSTFYVTLPGEPFSPLATVRRTDPNAT
jgi:PAS domain S-box-containing protein